MEDKKDIQNDSLPIDNNDDNEKLSIQSDSQSEEDNIDIVNIDMEDIGFLEYIEDYAPDTYGPMPVDEDSESMNISEFKYEDFFDTVYGPPPVDDDLGEDDIKEKH